MILWFNTLIKILVMKYRSFFDTIISTLPLLIMSMNNGSNSWVVLSALLIPLLTLLVERWKDIQHMFLYHIPSSYISYVVDVTRSNSIPSFSSSLAIFLKDMSQDTIRDMKIQGFSYDRPNTLSTSLRHIPTINLPDDFFHKIKITEEMVEKINKIEKEYPEKMDCKILANKTIYISVFKRKENSTDHRTGKIVDKDFKYVRFRASSLEVAECFTYIVSNYVETKKRSSPTFRLQKYNYYCTPSSTFTHSRCNLYLNKNFNNIFLSKNNQDLIVKSVRKWCDSRGKQLEMGIPNKLGLFLSGAPGCGKSSLIYAIANETRKTISSINLQKFNNSEFLYMMSIIEDSVVVFDDLDAYSFVKKREFRKMKDSEISDNSKSPESIKIISTPTKKKDSLTLDVLLDVLDGYCYLSNCIVIITSNHPEVIDPAVTRPGRMDHMINFELADEYQFQNIFEYFIGEPYTNYKPDYKFKRGIYSTSYLINTIILPNIDNPERIFSLLDE